MVCFRKWGGKRESNPQPPEPQSGALPVELFPPQATIIASGECERSFRPRLGCLSAPSLFGDVGADTVI